MRSRWNWRLLGAIAFLAIGATVSLPVAHACYLLTYQRTCHALDPGQAKRLWIGAGGKHEETPFGTVSTGIGWTYWKYGIPVDPGSPNFHQSRDHAAVGFPFRAFSGDGTLLATTGPTTNAWASIGRTSTRIGAIGEMFRWRPVWGGLFLNAMFYAGLFAACAFGPDIVRQWSRHRRGCCLRCGYDRRGTALDVKCPECGMPPR